MRRAEFLEFAVTHDHVALLFVNEGSKDDTLDLPQDFALSAQAYSSTWIWLPIAAKARQYG